MQGPPRGGRLSTRTSWLQVLGRKHALGQVAEPMMYVASLRYNIVLWILSKSYFAGLNREFQYPYQRNWSLSNQQAERAPNHRNWERMRDRSQSQASSMDAILCTIVSSASLLQQRQLYLDATVPLTPQMSGILADFAKPACSSASRTLHAACWCSSLGRSSYRTILPAR